MTDAAARNMELQELAWIERFTGILRHGASVLDIGFGSGEPIARYLAGRGHPITGVDGSPEMIALFRVNLPGETAECMDMRSLRLNQKYGGLVAWDSLFHLTPFDQRITLPILRELAEPKSPFAVTSRPAFGETIGVLGG